MPFHPLWACQSAGQNPRRNGCFQLPDPGASVARQPAFPWQNRPQPDEVGATDRLVPTGVAVEPEPLVGPATCPARRFPNRSSLPKAVVPAELYRWPTGMPFEPFRPQANRSGLPEPRHRPESERPKCLRATWLNDPSRPEECLSTPSPVCPADWREPFRLTVPLHRENGVAPKLSGVFPAFRWHFPSAPGPCRSCESRALRW